MYTNAFLVLFLDPPGKGVKSDATEVIDHKNKRTSRFPIAPQNRNVIPTLRETFGSTGSVHHYTCTWKG